MSIATSSFDAATPEEAIASWVASRSPGDEARAELVSILPEQHPLYRGRSANETARIRGYTLAAFEHVGLPADAVPYVLDELQNGDEAYLVAAAAKALRGAESPAAIGFALPCLEEAAKNIRYADAPVTFDVYKPSFPVQGCTTAAREIRATRQWIGEVDCCAIPSPAGPSRRRLDLKEVQLENQDGGRTTFGEFFSGKPSVVAFFYSRCENVRKCSLTVTKLAALQRELSRRGLASRVRLSAITYDPGFDLPPRLKQYGQERGVLFGEDVAFFRVLEGFDAVRAELGLGVNFAGTIVNRHRIELYLIDAKGRLASARTRLSWTEKEVADRLESLLRGGPLADAARAVMACFAAAGVALMPKCPLCLGAYASAMGVGGLHLAPYRSWLLPLALLFILAHLAAMTLRASRTRRSTPLVFSLAGAGALVAGSVIWPLPSLTFAGALAMMAGAVLSVVPRIQLPVFR